MSFLAWFLAVVSHDPLAPLYFVQSATYGMAFWASRFGKHGLPEVYLVSCLVHFTMGMMHRALAG